MQTPAIHPRSKGEVAALAAIAAILVVVAGTRREFIGDGVRHLSGALSGPLQFGEARWVLFPPLLFVVMRPLAAAGLVTSVQSAIQPLLWLDVACGIVLLWRLGAWLRTESEDSGAAVASLWLAAGCAPFLMLFSDIAEVQVAATVAVVALTYARTHQHGETGTLVAIAGIASAALIYQGTILALGMLPLVAPSGALRRRRVLVALAAALAAVLLVTSLAQIAGGLRFDAAARAAFGGERNPLARSLMTRWSMPKVVVASIAGPPQGIVALKDFAGIRALLNARHGPDAATRTTAAANIARLLLGLAVTSLLLVTTVRRRDWRLLFAAAIILILPLLRNQQYAYLKFFALWPVVVALAAVRCRPRTIALAAAIVLSANAWVVGRQVADGRRRYAALRQAFASASPETCWMTSGWAPPMWYLWPGTSAPVLGTLATGADPHQQSLILTAALQRCFCESAAVWTDTTASDTATLDAITTHFDYGVVDLTTLLLPDAPVPPTSTPEIRIYPADTQQAVCRRISSDAR